MRSFKTLKVSIIIFASILLLSSIFFILVKDDEKQKDIIDVFMSVGTRRVVGQIDLNQGIKHVLSQFSSFTIKADIETKLADEDSAAFDILIAPAVGDLIFIPHNDEKFTEKVKRILRRVKKIAA